MEGNKAKETADRDWVERFGEILFSHALPSPPKDSPSPTNKTTSVSFSLNFGSFFSYDVVDFFVVNFIAVFCNVSWGR